MQNHYEHFKQFVQAKTTGFDFGDSSNEEFLKNIVNYFSDGDTIYDKSKGLLIQGSYGVGKTSILKLIQKWLPMSLKFAYNPANDLVSLFNANGDAALNIYKEKKERMFDDIGAEDIGKNYGNNVEVFEKILLKRYDLWRYQGIKTHMTTNLNSELLLKKYGERVYDRLKEMVNVVVWNCAESKRGVNEFSFIQEEEKPVDKEPTQEELKNIANEYLDECLLKPYKDFNPAFKIGIDKHNALNLFKKFMSAGVVSITKEQIEEYRAKGIAALKESALVDSKNRKQMRALIHKLDLIPTEQDKSIELKIKEAASVEYFYDYIKLLKEQNTDLKEWLTTVKIYKP